MSFNELLNKHIPVPEIDPPHIDNSDDYTTTKITKLGYVKVLKPEVINAIKDRLEHE